MPSKDSGRPVTWAEVRCGEEIFAPIGRPGARSAREPMVAARCRARPVRMKGGRRCLPRIAKIFADDVSGISRTKDRLAVAGYLLSSSRLGGRLFVRRFCIGGGRSFWRTSAGFIGWECRSHAACPYVAASERQASVCARAICNSATARIDLPASEARYARSNGDHPKNPANMAGISASRSAELCPMSFSRLRCASIVARSRPPS